MDLTIVDFEVTPQIDSAANTSKRGEFAEGPDDSQVCFE